MGTNKPMLLFSLNVENLEQCKLINPIPDDAAMVLATTLAASDPWLSLNISAKMLARYFVHENIGLHRYMVQVDDEIAGVLCVRYPWLRGPYIEFLGLTVKFRGLGLGRLILQWAEAEARRESGNLWVATSSFNHKALKFYQQLGFYQIGIIEGLIVPEHDEILLRKRLN